MIRQMEWPISANPKTFTRTVALIREHNDEICTHLGVPPAPGLGFTSYPTQNPNVQILVISYEKTETQDKEGVKQAAQLIRAAIHQAHDTQQEG